MVWRILRQWSFIAACSLVIVEVHAVAAFSICPSGQVYHPLPDTDTGSRCCHPWKFNCPPDYPYTVCDTDGGWDKCLKCPSGSIQPSFSNTSNPMSCYGKNNEACAEDQIPVRHPSTGKLKSCICDRSQNYFNQENTEGCDYARKSCPEGTELQLNSSCTTCSPGTYKNWDGKGLCIPTTNCFSEGKKVLIPSRPDSDNQCTSTHTTISVITPTTTHITETAATVTNSSDPHPGGQVMSTDSTWILGVFIPLAIIIVIIVGSILYCRIRKRCCFAGYRLIPGTETHPRIPPNGSSVPSCEEIQMVNLSPASRIPNGGTSLLSDEGGHYETIREEDLLQNGRTVNGAANRSLSPSSRSSMGHMESTVTTRAEGNGKQSPLPPPPTIPGDTTHTPPLTTPSAQLKGIKPCAVVSPLPRAEALSTNITPDQASPDPSVPRFIATSNPDYGRFGGTPRSEVSDQGIYNGQDLGVMEFPEVEPVPRFPVALAVMRVQREVNEDVPVDDTSAQTSLKGS